MCVRGMVSMSGCLSLGMSVSRCVMGRVLVLPNCRVGGGTGVGRHSRVAVNSL